MARKPVYGHHKPTGRARTTHKGKRVYLGDYGSAESHRRYEEILAEWEAARAGRDTLAQTTLSVDRLALLFMRHAVKEYVRAGEQTGEAKNFRYALKDLLKVYSGCRCIDFGPKKLKSLQGSMVGWGLSQSTINGRIRRIRQVFEWGVSEELVPPRTHQGLKSVKGLRSGRTKAPAPCSSRAVPVERVEATLTHMTRPVAAMVQLMLLTGCRPKEARMARWSEISTGGDIWTYEPADHKTAHRGHRRLVHIGPRCQKVLNAIREHTRSDYVFDPQVAVDEHVRSEYGEHARARQVGEHYTADSLRTAIRTACERARSC